MSEDKKEVDAQDIVDEDFPDEVMEEKSPESKSNEAPNEDVKQEVEVKKEESPASPESSSNSKMSPQESYQQQRNTGINSNSGQYKRNVAFKLRVGEIMSGSPIMEGERMRALNLLGNEVVRVNVIANVTDKFVQDGEKKYATLTLDDATGQIRLKTFGDDVDKFNEVNQGDTVMVIGLVRSWNNEIYLTPEIISKKTPEFLLVRKLERDLEKPAQSETGPSPELKSKIIDMVKAADEEGGVFVDKIIMELKENPEVINNEIKQLLESGVAYEPRPGKLRYLG